MKLLSFTVAFAVMVVLFGRAIDHEIGRAGANQGHNSVSVMSAAWADSALSERAGTNRSDLRNADGRVARDEGPARSESVPPPVQLEQPGYRYQGLTARAWAKRAVQQRKNSTARGRTIRRLQSAQRREAAHFFAWLRGAECVHSHERGADGWATNTGNGYYGGMQANLSFQRTYAPAYYRAWGTANNWPMWAQLHMAYNGWVARAWEPWPSTARECGLR